MNDKIRINLQMAGANFPLVINREDEEMVRGAAKQVETKLNAYREYYPQLPKEQLITMVAYQFALECLQLQKRNDTAPWAQRIGTLSQMLDEYFEEVREV